MPGMTGFSGIIPDSFMAGLQNLQDNGVIDTIGKVHARLPVAPFTNNLFPEPDGEMTTQ
jgi:hypothetical protein